LFFAPQSNPATAGSTPSATLSPTFTVDHKSEFVKQFIDVREVFNAVTKALKDRRDPAGLTLAAAHSAPNTAKQCGRTFPYQ